MADEGLADPMISLRLVPPGRRRPGVISATVPSRGREAKLAASVRSLRDRAARPDLLEILVACDPDDPGTATAAAALGADVIWEAPERYGYAGSSRYYARLLEQAAGEWLLVTWSDDALMVTQGWDDLLRAQPAGSVAYLDGNYAGLTCFPAVHGDALGAVGRLPPLPALDTWFEDAARDAGVLVTPGVYVHQDRPDLTGCPADRTHIEGGGAWRPSHSSREQAFYREPYATWRAGDAAALRRLAALEDEYAGRLAVWSDMAGQMPALRDAVRSCWQPAVAELGCRTGESTAALLAGAAAAGGHVWSVDCGTVTVPDWWRDAGLWSFHAGDDLSAAAAAFIPAVLDVLLIDTSHLYDHTLAELRAYAPRVRPGGLVLCHDTELSRDQMTAYGEAAAASGPVYPVAAALDAYCQEAGLTWTRQPRPAGDGKFFGLGTITIPGGDTR